VRSKMVAVCLVALALLVTSACGGSEISPQAALKANQSILGQGSGAGTDTTGTDTTGTTGTGDTGTPTGTATTGTGTTGTTGTTGGTAGTTGTAGTGGKPNKPGKGQTTAAGGFGGIKVGSCDGFKNQTGITDQTITIGNSSDISGPVPGLFTGAQQATKAYVAYFNATSSICGRKLQLLTYDSRTDAGADQQGYQKICENSFAGVGSMSAFDSGGAATAQSCGLPDIRTASVTGARNDCTTCFGVQSTGKGEYQNEVYDYWIRTHKDATQKAAFLYLNAGAAAENAKTQISVGTKRGMNWVYTAGIDVAAFDYGSYVQQMKSKGVQFVQFLGAYQQSARLAKAMQSAGFKPEVLMYDPSVYEPGFLTQGGSAVEGANFFVNFTPLNESQPELNLYKKWLQQVAPGAQPTFFGLFAWSAAKLFVEKSLELGGKLTRPSLVAAVKSVDGWTGGGAHSPMSVGSKHPPVCVRWMTVKGGAFVPAGDTKYTCGGYTSAG
jgi:ABC-type branched-subunit amino acid transport system substrate-binding protein